MKDQYHQIIKVTEWVEDYRIGGLYPIHIGDHLCKDRYKIIRKLGYGAFSTVWLAKDHKYNRYVAIKVLLAKTSPKSTELQLLHFTNKNSSFSLLSKYVVQLFDEFKEVGPNGIHQCLVSEVSGPNLNDLMFSKNVRRKRPDHFTLRLMKMISFQIISGVTYLHDLGICHGDLQPGNIVTSISDIDSIKESNLYVDLDPKWNSPPVKRLDGKDLDQSAPRYLLTSKPLMHYIDFGDKFAVKITDLGGAFFERDPPKKIVTPTGLRAPEIIFGEQVDKSIDVWSLACLIFEIVTSVPLFRIIEWGSTPEETDDEHLVHFVTTLGKMPKNLQSKWKRYNLCYGPDGKQIHQTDVDVYPLREYLFREKPEGMSEQDAESLLSLLRQMLQYDPSKRISAREALEHPWLAKYVSSK